MIYEYRCLKCNRRFELRRPISQAKDDAFCPLCQGRAERIFSNFALFSKGGKESPSSIGSSTSRCNTCTATSCATCH